MNQELTKSAREVIGQYLHEMREEKKISMYRIVKETNLTYDVINAIEDGSKNYTIDSFLSYTTAIGAYLFFGDKSGKDESKALDIDHMLEEGEDKNPFKG